MIKVVPFEATEHDVELAKPHTPLTPSRPGRTPLLKKLVSIRVVLVAITVIIVMVMAVGLIMLSVRAQEDTVSNLSSKIQDEVAVRIVDQLENLFSWADKELQASHLMFQITKNLSVPAVGTNPFREWEFLSEYLFSIVRMLPTGVETEFDLLDGRMFGIESFDDFCDVYWVDLVDDSLFEVGWVTPLNQTLASDEMTPDNYEYTYVMGAPVTYLFNDSRDFLNSCTAPNLWFDISIYVGSDAAYETISDYTVICNSEGQMLGTLSVGIGLSSVVALLEEITSEIVDGKVFIMDSQEEPQLVASSTGTEIFNINWTDGSSVRNTILTTSEVWIQDVVSLMDGNYGEQSKTVHVNGSTYYLTVTKWDQMNGVSWYIVKLLDQAQFLGNSHRYFAKSVIAAACVSVAGVIVVLAVTWATTKPLFILAADLQKMSRLDLEISDMETPRLFEVSKLYRSVASMYIALRSFKKFVPVQIISNIIKSEKEVSPELHPAKVTIIFQDIEGFTSLSEKMNPVALAHLTGEYMETMTEIICKHGGTIDKYIGDCIMSIFNAPEEVPNHPAAATQAAVECMDALYKKNVEWKSKYGVTMMCRIGINTGEVLIGNMGSIHRMNYTAFGDNVNVAARLEGINKHYGTRIIVSKSAYANFPKNKFLARKLAKVRVSGKALPTSIFEVRGGFAQNTIHQFSLYENALSLFKKKDLLGALEKVDSVLDIDKDDKAARVLKARIQEAINNSPLPDNWNYIEDLLKL